MRSFIRIGAVASAVFAVVFAATGVRADTGSPTGVGATGAGGPGSNRHYCRTVLDKLQPGEQFSRVISHTCADRPEELHINAGTLLIRWFEDAGYGGMWYKNVEGAAGPCDYDGYGLRDTGSRVDPWVPYWWRNNISSFQVFNRCTNVDTYTEIGYGGDLWYWRGDQSNLGRFNDRVRSMRLTYRP